MDGKEPGFTLVKKKKAPRKAKAATTTKGPGSRGTADPRSSGQLMPESASSGKPGLSGVAKPPETAAGRQGQMADPGDGEGLAGP